jgi:hypothetical protein
MMRLLLRLGILSLLPAVVSADHHYDQRYYRDYSQYRQEPLIVVDTKDCGGELGLASFRAERVFKIQTGKCQDPDDSGKPLYQVMLKSLMGEADYEIVWVDAAGMLAIREQLLENRKAALKRREIYQSREVFEDEGQ